jgi:fatty-acyl-CoA synthase
LTIWRRSADSRSSGELAVRASQEVSIDAPAAALWELIGEPSLYPRFLRDVTRWEKIAGDEGSRPRYHIEVRVGGVELGAVVEITHASAPHELGWESVSGIEHHGHWRVRSDGDRRCTVALDLSYRAPGEVLGMIADGAALPLLHQGLRESLARLKADVEGSAPTRGVVARIAGDTREAVYDAGVLARTGLLAPARPDRLVRAAWELAQWDATLAAGCAIAATLHPDDRALVDDRGTWTFAEIHRRTNALARGLQEAGVDSGDRVAILCRNHAGFAEALLAASKLGVDVLLLSTGLAAPQLREVLRRERPRALIHDEEFVEGVKIRGLRRFVAWHDGPGASAITLDELIAGGDTRDMSPPSRHAHVVILTSGTTGSPKAATRPESENLRVPLALLDRIPLRARHVTHIVSPLFHSWGYMHFGLAVAVSATLVLRRRFDPEDLLADIERERVDSLALVPTMLARILELPPAVRRRHDTSSLRVVAVSGSALQGDLATRFMDEFGDILYNLYGSTVVSWAAIATPADLRAAPGTVGRPPRGTRVAILDELGRRAPAGSRGRIFVRNETAFEGYTDGGGRQVIDGLVSAGDIGHVDDAGRLFVDGREDDMIVSGGENIFPSEVEDALARHPSVAEVAVVGIEDERFGQRLKAYVIAANGAAVSEDELKQLVRTRLAPFKVPREIEFVTELPRTATGKVAKAELGEPRR